MVIVGRDTASLDGERQSAPVGDSCRKILLVERASCLPAHCTRRLDDEVPRVRGARDTRFPLERRLDRDGVLIAYRQLASEDEPAEYPGGSCARYLVEECGHDPAVRHPRRAVIGIGDRVLADDPVASAPEAHPQTVRAGGPAAAVGKEKLMVLGLGHLDSIIFSGTLRTQRERRCGAPCLADVRRLRTAASSSVTNNMIARS